MPEEGATLTTAFAGSPEFAARVLAGLSRGPFRPELVLTQPDRPKGRGRKLQPCAVKETAEALGIPVVQPPSLRAPAATVELAALAPDVLIVAAYGLILPQRVLDLPSFGCINVHASLLPRWRGAAPIERALMAGDARTGVSIMQMEAGLDTGPVYCKRELAIADGDTAEDLEVRLAELGGEALGEVLEQLAASRAGAGPVPTAEPQDDAQATYASKLTAADREVDWEDSAAVIARRIRALGGRLPVTVHVPGMRVQLLAGRAHEAPSTSEPGTITRADTTGIYVQCATGHLQIEQLRLSKGKGSVLDAAAALNGYPDAFAPGRRLETQPLE